MRRLPRQSEEQSLKAGPPPRADFKAVVARAFVVLAGFAKLIIAWNVGDLAMLIPVFSAFAPVPEGAPASRLVRR